MRKMKLPQGVGQVYKLKGTRRNPYIVRKTIGFENVNGKKKQIIKTIGYAKTYQDGFNMLMSYNSDLVKNPNETKVVVTPECKYKFKDIFEKWSKDSFPTTSKSTMNGYNAAFKGFVGLHNKVFATLKTRDYERIIADSGKNYSTIRKMKFLLNMLYKFALKNEYVDKNYSKFVKFDKYKKAYKKKIKNVYKESEIEYIWKNSGELIYRILLMLLYTGLRISELLELKTKDLNLQERYITITNSKTNNGIRKVPIPSCIYQMVKHQYNGKKEYFLYDGAYKYNYGQIRVLFDNFKKKSNMNHTIHETRHTYTSRLRLRGVDSTFTKKLTGHSAGNVDEDTYTHVSICDLYKIVNDAFEEDMKYVG